MITTLTFLALSQAAPAATLDRTAWLVATVGHSEWCPAGNVRLDLRTGRFDHTLTVNRRQCGSARVERPVRRGTLDARRLERVRAAFLRADAEGLEDPICRNGGRPQVVVISNGGTPILVLTTSARTRSAPDDRSCWSGAAIALHEALEDAFVRARQRMSNRD